jgi:hypothetical protein
MSYKSAIEAAGAIVLEIKEFGDCQGSWFAFVDYKGERGWVMGSYGSCTECDAFESEFDSDYADGCLEHLTAVDGCEFCVQQGIERQERLASFGESYLSPISDLAVILKQLYSTSSWDEESAVAAAWVQSVDEQYNRIH